MGKSIRSKVQKKWRAQRREKLADWERQRTEELHQRLMNDVAAQDAVIRETRLALVPPTETASVKKETVTVEIEDGDSDVRMLSVTPRIRKSPRTTRKKTAQRTGS